MSKYLLLVSVLFVIVQAKEGELKNRTKLVIDNDAGGDDAMAIFLALLYEKHFNGPKVVALTTTHGNTAEENVSVNNRRILRIANREDVPIYRGSKKSLVVTPKVDNYYGIDGLGDIGDIPEDLVAVQEKGAIDVLIELSKTYEDELVVVTLGSLTNVALAIAVDPGFLGRLKHLYVAAGFILSERFPRAEFNARTDAEAYHIVMEAATTDKVTIVPYSTTQLTLDIDKSWRNEVLGAIQSDIIRAQNSFERIAADKHASWNELDPATVAVAINPGLVKDVRPTKNVINLCGEIRGIIHNDFNSTNNFNANLVQAIRKEDYKKFLFEVFSADVQSGAK